MRKKDYELIENSINYSYVRGWIKDLEKTSNNMADELEKADPKFDRTKFLQGCGIETDGHSTTQDQASAIEQLLNTKTREAIVEYVNGYGDSVDWSDHTTRQILEEVTRSDNEAGEADSGILASMYQEL